MTEVAFGEWLKRRRAARGLTQEQLARQVGCSTITLRKIEAEERRPSEQIVERLAVLFEVVPEDRESFLRFARGDWRSVPHLVIEEAPWRASTTSPRSNLPIPLTSFIGREKETDEIILLLDRNRLVTLTGPGGVGKTRLALQASNKVLNKFEDGVWWVDLAPLSDGVLVPRAVAQALGVRESPTQLLAESLRVFLHKAQILLVLDNCEHLIAGCAQLADHLLAGCAHLRILTTSREVLGITGEMAFQVPTLSLPKSTQPVPRKLLLDFEAIRLFVERAGLIKSDFALTEQNAAAVLRICHRLDGIPLAIELVAAHINRMSPDEIERHLDDRFSWLTTGGRTSIPRHQTLQSAIDWSYNLLSDHESALFRRSSVFAGGFTLEAAEAVCAGEDLKRDEILDLLSQLGDKSLVVAGTSESVETRYHLLETIRQYAQAKLVGSGESGRLQDVYLDFFLKFAEEAEPNLMSAEAPRWLDRIQSDWDNIRLAIRWSLESDRGAKGLRIASALKFFAYLRGYLREFYQILLELLKSQSRAKRTTTLGNGLFTAAVVGAELGNLQDARPLYEESIAILKESGEEGRGLLETVLSYYAYSLVWGEPRAAARYAQEAVDLCRESGNRDGLALALDRLAEAFQLMNDCASARVLLSESVLIAQELGNQFTYLVSTTDLGVAYFYDGDLEIAKKYFEEVHPLFAKTHGVAFINSLLGAIARIQEQPAVAKSLLEEAVRFLREAGDNQRTVMALVFLGRLELDQANWVAAERCFSEALFLARKASAACFVSWSLESFAYLFMALNQAYRAVSFLGAAEASRERLGTPILPIERREYESSLAAAHAQLDEATFAKAWAEGRALAIEQAIELALQGTN